MAKETNQEVEELLDKMIASAQERIDAARDSIARLQSLVEATTEEQENLRQQRADILNRDLPKY